MSGVRLFLMLALGVGATAPAATFGRAYPLLGEFSDLALDEPRSLLYLSNFTAGRIDVWNLNSGSLEAPIRVGINPSSVALFPDGKSLLILNFTSPSAFVVNLETRAVQTLAIPPVADAAGVPVPANLNLPRAVAFGSDGAALIITSHQLLRYDPASGLIAVLVPQLGPLLGALPVPQPTFPPEILNARMAVSEDRNTIFVVGSFQPTLHFAFYYDVPTRRLVSRCASAVSSPVRFASIARDGLKFMGGGVLFDRQLRVLADFVPSGQLPIKVAPTTVSAPPPNAPPPRPEAVIGGTEFSRDGATIFASLVDPTARDGPPLLYVLDSDNLTVRERILIPDRLFGKMVSNAAGTKLYALSEAGLTVLPIGELAVAPRLAPGQDIIGFRFNVCSKLPTTVTFEVVNLGAGSVPFSLSTDMVGLRLEPSFGTTPATITATFDPEKLNNVRGTALGTIRITGASAVNVAESVRVVANLQDTDQRGTIFPQRGTLRDVLIDDARQRFYLLDSERNRLLVFDLNDFSLRRTVRTGYFPLHLATTRDQKRLLVTNAQSETISVINLETLEFEGFVYCPCSAYPRSIAFSTNATLAITAVDRPRTFRTADNQTSVQLVVTEGRVNRVDLARHVVVEPAASLGIFINDVSPRSLLTATPNGALILIGEDAGLAKMYEADSDTFVLARAISDRPLRGGVAATDAGLYNAGAVMLGSSLIPLAEFRDSPDEHIGLVFTGNQIVRTLKPATGGGSGLITRVDAGTLQSVRAVKLAEAPLGFPEDQPLRRSLSGTSDGRLFVLLSGSGFEVVPGSFDAFVSPPVARSVVNAASSTGPVAPGSLISIFGDNLAPLTSRAGAAPLPTFLADTCLTVNNVPVPLLFLSPGQINAQLPFEVTGNATLIIHAPGGVSDPFAFDTATAAPALFQSNFGGQASPPLPIILRAFNQEPVTVSNPARRGDVLVLFGNGLGRVSPPLASGAAAPAGALFRTVAQPAVTIGGRPAEVLFSGLAPGFVGLNQLNIVVPPDAPLGFGVALQISSGGVTSETVLARVAAELER